VTLGDERFHKRLPRFESFDRFELVVVPRYKTSGLSGDEWRQSIAIRFYFKGELVHEDGAHTMRAAIAFLGWKWATAQEPIPERVLEIEKTKCDQPSCTNDWTNEYELIEEFSRSGERLDPKDRHFRHYRRFCNRHARRGDCSREDADRNYKVLNGAGPDGSTNVEESPSSFGGVVYEDEGES